MDSKSIERAVHNKKKGEILSEVEERFKKTVQSFTDNDKEKKAAHLVEFSKVYQPLLYKAEACGHSKEELQALRQHANETYASPPRGIV